MDLDFVSVHKNAKKELGQYATILTSRLVNNAYVIHIGIYVSKELLKHNSLLRHGVINSVFIIHWFVGKQSVLFSQESRYFKTNFFPREQTFSALLYIQRMKKNLNLRWQKHNFP